MKHRLCSKFLQGAILSVILVYVTFFNHSVLLRWKYKDVSDGDVDLQSIKNTNRSGVRLLRSLFFSPEQSRRQSSEPKITKNEPKIVNKRHSLLDDIFISVKTSGKFHKSRLDVILKTWYLLAREQTWFFTDTNDPLYQNITGQHMINTNCSSSHDRKDLCCKMSVEFDAFMDSYKKWFCHFDDDNYVNIPKLVDLLQHYDPMRDWYLGRKSIKEPLKIVAKDGEKSHFWFATGGAGLCISRSLALKMVPIAGGGRFISVGERIGLPDDVTLGYIIEHVMKHNLTEIKIFHSHLESMKLIKDPELEEQVTFSYTPYGNKQNTNVVLVDGFNMSHDPTRFLSLHCRLFPNFNFCPKEAH